MVETRPQPGWREVLLVSLAVVAVVLGAAVATSLLPSGVQETIFHRPVLILVLIVGTGWLLWRIARPRRSTEDPAHPTPDDHAAGSTPGDTRTDDRP